MSKYIFGLLLIILINCVIAETISQCSQIDDATSEGDCHDIGTSSENYVCVFNSVDNTCVEIIKSECNEVYEYEVTTQQEIRRRLTVDDELCRSKRTSDDSKYNCVPKNQVRCIEQGKSECLQNTIYSQRRRLSATGLTDDDCKDLSVTSQGKKCVVSADKTKCDEVDEVNKVGGKKVNFSYGLNINKLSLFILCLLFF